MAIADPSTTTAKVKRQYDTFPYPHRDPADEDKRLVGTSLDDLAVLNHYCFRGRRDFRRGFRVLVAGGGTGDSTIFLGCQLVGSDAQIVHLDLSEAAIETARQRARRRGFGDRISWVHGSLLDLPSLGLGSFDYVNCVGVLHHLDDPLAGLMALRSVTKDDGAIALMLYGRYARAGIYQMQRLMQLVNADQRDPQTMVDNTRVVLSALPPSNWLKRAQKLLPEDDLMNDAEIYDMFLHAQDRPFSVPEVYDLLDRAGLQLVEFARQHRTSYEPWFAFASAELRARVERLPKRQQQASAELFWGTINKHMFWASRRSDTVADPRDPDNVPLFTRFAQDAGVRESILNARGEAWKMNLARADSPTISIKLRMDAVVRRLVELIDDRSTMGQIVAQLAGGNPRRPLGQIWSLCSNALETLRIHDLVVLRHVSVPAIPAW